MKNYKVFKYDSRNSGFYVGQDLSFSDARDIAKRLSKTNFPKSRVEGLNGFFEEYENGEVTSWSVAGNGLPANLLQV